MTTSETPETTVCQCPGCASDDPNDGCYWPRGVEWSPATLEPAVLTAETVARIMDTIERECDG